MTPDTALIVIPVAFGFAVGAAVGVFQRLLFLVLRARSGKGFPAKLVELTSIVVAVALALLLPRLVAESIPSPELQVAGALSAIWGYLLPGLFMPRALGPSR